MRRRSNRDAGVLGDLLDALYRASTILPWYIDAALAMVLYFGLHYLTVQYQLNGVHGGWHFLVAMLALVGQYVLPGILVTGGFVSLFHSIRSKVNGKELLSHASANGATEVVSKMNWLEFELLIGAWFKEQGYEVTQAGGADTGSAHADGGIDVELHKDGELFLVQCKHYRSWNVPVETIRDLYGVMTSRGAAGGFVVTSGYFTKPAKDFAAGRSITLIDGEQLSQIINSAKPEAAEIVPEQPHATPLCPVCSSAMVQRTAHRGANAGHTFWGCSQYPACRGIVSGS
ncbi:MAG: restriction endonuclease [Candidatus Pacebacteria bacterium]|nr:restriction endonuclease [Candidatus Paceibacterota bacterium]